jgi:hypothetical protein
MAKRVQQAQCRGPRQAIVRARESGLGTSNEG